MAKEKRQPNGVCAACQEEPKTPRTPFCKTCGPNISGWKRRRPAERLLYRHKLQIRSARMDLVLEETKK